MSQEFIDLMERVTGGVPELVAPLKDSDANHTVNKAIASLFKPGALLKEPA